MRRSVSPTGARGHIEFARSPSPDLLVWRVSGSVRDWTCVLTNLSIALIDDASSEFWYRGVVSRSEPGDTVVIEPDRVYRSWNQTGAGNFRVIELPSDWFAATGAGRAPEFHQPLVRDADLRETAERLHGAVEGGTDPAELSQRTRALAERLVRHATPAQPETPALDCPTLVRVREHINQNLSSALSIEALARVADMSRFSFVRAWKRVIGLPPHAYVVHRRVMAARKKLAQGQPIAVVADECGFHDQSHLHRHFKRITGVTPGQFQRSLR